MKEVDGKEKKKKLIWWKRDEKRTIAKSVYKAFSEVLTIGIFQVLIREFNH